VFFIAVSDGHAVEVMPTANFSPAPLFVADVNVAFVGPASILPPKHAKSGRRHRPWRVAGGKVQPRVAQTWPFRPCAAFRAFDDRRELRIAGRRHPRVVQTGQVRCRSWTRSAPARIQRLRHVAGDGRAGMITGMR